MQSTEKARPRRQIIALIIAPLEVVSIVGTIGCYALAAFMSDYNIFRYSTENPFVYAALLFALASPVVTLVLALVRRNRWILFIANLVGCAILFEVLSNMADIAKHS